MTGLVIGLRRDDRALRLGAQALLLVTVGKSLPLRPGCADVADADRFVGLGLSLLVAAGISGRGCARCGALQGQPDVREAPPAVR